MWSRYTRVCRSTVQTAREQLPLSNGLSVTGCSSQLLSLGAWHKKQSLQGTQAGTAGSHQNFQQRGSTVSWLLAAGIAAAGAGVEAHCEASSYAADQANRSGWSRLLHHADPRQIFYAKERNDFLEEMQVDTKVQMLPATLYRRHTDESEPDAHSSCKVCISEAAVMVAGLGGASLGPAILVLVIWLCPCQA